MTVTAVIIGHAAQPAIRDMVFALSQQTVPPDEIIVCACCVRPFSGPWRMTILDRHEDDWGQRFCEYGLKLATSDYVFFASCDDGYDPTFIEKMSGHDVDLTYCDFDCRIAGPNRSARPQLNHTTRGGYMVRRSKALEVGYNHRCYDGDGRFVDDMVAAGSTLHHVQENLHAHR